ncbi:MAG TPA: NucA/NucB deoxyribonuclease domain-containing protein [Burkholderiales bacterium]|nr:NucA/NucB deoxyribonuclease domain-containing protein [Burkholderiales bacterium]
MTPDWKAHKPKANDGSLPVLQIDFKNLPVIATGIWHAQMAGWERILTYDYVANTCERRKSRGAKRAGINTSGFQRCGLTADEYPFACTKENTGSTFLTNAPAAEQRVQGGELNAFFSRHGAYTATDRYFYFEVKVINYVYKR